MSAPRRPAYVRMLRLRRLSPRPWLSFLLFEGSVLFGLLLALSELVPWQVAVSVPLLLTAAVKLADEVADRLTAGGSDSGDPQTSAGVMRQSVASVRAQQRAGRGASASRAVAARSALATHAPSPLPRERGRRVARGIAAVPDTMTAPAAAPAAARARSRQARSGRVVGAWPMPVDTAATTWAGPTVTIPPDAGAAAGAGEGGPNDGRGGRTREGNTRSAGRGRNQGRFAAHR